MEKKKWEGREGGILSPCLFNFLALAFVWLVLTNQEP